MTSAAATERRHHACSVHVLAVLAAAVTLTSVARRSRGSEAAVGVTAEVLGKAVLDPLQQGVLKRDAGTVGGVLPNTPDRVVMREGQKVEIYTSTWTFTGKRGSLTFRERNQWVDVDAGTGSRTPLPARGRSCAARPVRQGRWERPERPCGARCSPLLWKVRLEGFVSVP